LRGAEMGLRHTEIASGEAEMPLCDTEIAL
jgi:hypothetical protein